MISHLLRFFHRKFLTANFAKYAVTGVIFTIINTVLIWIFVDYIVLFPKEINTPLITMATTTLLFVFRYFVFQWIGFTKNDEMK